MVLDLNSGKLIQRLPFGENEYPSAIAYKVFDQKKAGFEERILKVFVGASKLMDAEAGQEQFYSPQLGKIYSYVFDVELMIECGT